MSNGSCLRDALLEAGYNLSNINIPDWTTTTQAKNICEKLGIVYYHNVILEIAENEPVIAIYCTTENKLHAEYRQDLGELIANNKQFVGIIKPT